MRLLSSHVIFWQLAELLNPSQKPNPNQVLVPVEDALRTTLLHIVFLSVLVLAMMIVTSCGGTSNTASNSPGSSSANPGPAAAPGSGGSGSSGGNAGGGSSGGSGGGTSGTGSGGNTTPSAPSGPDTYLAQIFQVAERFPNSEGQLTLNNKANDGSGVLQFSHASTNTGNLVLRFCQYAFNPPNCFNITSLATDANGNGTVNFTFPRKGTVSGAFQITLNGDQWGYAATGTSGKNFQSALLPASSITGGINLTTGNAQGWGSIVVNDTTGHMVLNQTTPNHTFNTAICGPTNSCLNLGNVSTDAQGNASADIGSVQAAGGSVFRVSDENGVQFVSAFRVQ